MNSQIGKIILIAGVILIIIGLLMILLNDKLSLFGWFGKLPGDIRIERPNFKFYFPIVSLLIVTAVLNLLIYVFKKIG
jgi:hypothetical protein